MGFSAGGHLAAMTSTLWNRTLPEEAGNPLKNISSRPDFSMLIYPVISMAPHTTHGGTRNKILGPHPSPALEEMCSAERQVTEQTPPVFLVHALDDGVSCANSRLMEQACRNKGVPASLNLYPTGGHGYGMENAGIPRINGRMPPNNGSGNRGFFLPRLLSTGALLPAPSPPPEHGGNECARNPGVPHRRVDRNRVQWYFFRA